MWQYSLSAEYERPGYQQNMLQLPIPQLWNVIVIMWKISIKYPLRILNP